MISSEEVLFSLAPDAAVEGADPVVLGVVGIEVAIAGEEGVLAGDNEVEVTIGEQATETKRSRATKPIKSFFINNLQTVVPSGNL